MPDFICTADNPWSQAKDTPDTRVIHPEALEVSDQINGWPSGDIVTYECPHCKHRWTQELPQ